MSRTQRGPIDHLGGYTVIDPFIDPVTGLPDPPQEDYYHIGGITIWGIGLITFGPPTAAQQAWLANSANYADLSTFPTDWISMGFPIGEPGPLEIWGTMWVSGVVITEEGIKGADGWSIGGLTGTGTFFFSDTHVSNGTAAGETISGSAAPETINGLAGNDILIGSDGSDALYGGAGNDHLIGGAGPDRLWGGEGNDLLQPDSDAAFIYILTAPARDGIYFVDGGAGFDTLLLDYSASDKSQVIAADTVLASDKIVNVEAVSIIGSEQSDLLSGSANADQLFGGGGFDVLRGGGGDDLLDAGAPGSAAVIAIGEAGRTKSDALSLDYLFTDTAGVPNASFYIRQTEVSVIDWGVRPYAGNIYSFTVGEAGAQAFIDYGVEGNGGTAGFGFVVTDENGVEIPTSYNPATPIIFPHAGTYYLQVNIGSSNIWSYGEIWVTLSIEGGLTAVSSNILEGGTGNDTYNVYAASDQVIERAGEGIDTVRSSVTWNLGANLENLTLTGASATNGSGNGLANLLIGNGAANVLDGSAGNDGLLGGSGGDFLIGGTGNDVLGGGAGADTLVGGIGRDIFLFTAAELGSTRAGPHDAVIDFASGDKIDISALYQGTMFGGIKAGSAADAASISGFKAVYYFEGGKTYLIGDTDGVAGANFTVELAGLHKLTVGDLLVGKTALRDWDRLTDGLDYQLFHDTAGSLAQAFALRDSLALDDMADQFRSFSLPDIGGVI